MKLIISSVSGEPIYEQIKNQIRSAIMSGELMAGEALPSLRKLAKELRVSVLANASWTSSVKFPSRPKPPTSACLICLACSRKHTGNNHERFLAPQGTRPTLALSVTGLTKHYDSGFTLDDVTFDLPSGYIMGLVGPNGAGKSTLIKLILNMTTRDAGRIEVLGLDAMADEERVKEQLGVVLDSSYFIEYMTVDAVERTSRPMYPLWDHNLFDAYLRRFGLGRNKKIKDLSRGMQMKLMLAVALSHDAKLLILDEPTSGLDVLSRDELMDILSDYVADGGHSVIFSTHITADLERCADFLAYITNGMLYYSGPKDEFEDAFRLVKGGPDELTDGLRRAMVGIRTYATGFDALVRTQDIPHIGGTDGLLTQHASIEDVIRLTNAAAHTAIGNTNEVDVR